MESNRDATPTRWCPSCGAEYVAGSERCPDCRVALVADPPGAGTGAAASDLVELGEWGRLDAMILRRRLDAAGVPVMIEWSGGPASTAGTLVVPEEHGDFAWSLVQEMTPAEQVPDASPEAYVDAIEQQLAELAGLVAELRTGLEGDLPA